MDTDLVRIEKLQNEDQWLSWKFQVKIVLNASELLDLVNGSSSLPIKASGQSDADFQKILKSWKLQDSRAQKIIATTIGQQPMLHIMNCSTARDMWVKLESVYEQKTQTSIHLLQQRFYSYTKDSDDSMSVHISKLEKIVQQLKDLGENISESMIITKILMTLPASYNHFFSAWESTNKSEQTLKNLTTRLLMEESRILQQNPSTSSEAFIAKKFFKRNVNQNRSHQKGTKPGKCFVCKQNGHWKADCPTRCQKQKQDVTRFRKPNESKGDAFVSECFLSDADKSDDWFLDSGASDHMTFRMDWLVNYEKFDVPMPVRVGNGETIFAYGSGDVNVLSFDNFKWNEKHLSNVLYVPEIRLNLFSSSSALDKGLKLTSDNQKCELLKENKVVAVGVRWKRLFKLLFKVMSNDKKVVQANSAVNETKTLKLWHERLVHQNFDQVEKILKGENIKYKANGDRFCESCVMAKHHRSTFHRSDNRAKKPGELVHTDICGPMHEVSYGGARYFILFKDDYSNYRKVYFLKEKSEVCGLIERFISEIKIETNHVVKCIRSDNGLEYANKEVNTLLSKHGICHQTSVPYTPEHNGRAERDMRTLVEAARSLIYGRSLSKKLWAEAINTCAYVLNRSGKSPVEEKVPYELWFKKKPSLIGLKVFGTDVYVHVDKQKRKKWDQKSKKGIFVGYCENIKGFRIWLPDERKIEISCHVIFRETSNQEGGALIDAKNDTEELLSKQEPENIKKEENIRQEIATINQDQDSVRQSDDSDNDIFLSPKPAEKASENPDNIASRLRSRKQISHTYCSLLSDGYAFISECEEPKTYEDALKSKFHTEWKNAMDEEISSQLKNNTWDLVERPHNRKILDNKWVYKIKKDADEKVKRFKARLVVRGFCQEYGIDYLETFSPVVRFTSIRTILAVAAAQRLTLVQFDIKTAFLYGELKENIFMTQPKGYEDGTSKVCVLRKSLYGLKQSSRCWNEKFCNFLKKFDFKVNTADPCVFSCQKEGKSIILAIYIDDGLVAASDCKDIEMLLKYLKQEFEIKSSSANLFLGLEIITKVDGSIFVNQANYASKVLKKFNMHDSKAVSTPAVSLQHPVFESKTSSGFPYREAVGSLMYLAIATRPDISFAVGVVSRFLDDPKINHINAVKRILKYINGTRNHGILFSNKSEFCLNIFSDADYGGDINTRRSTSGFVTCLGNSAISWQSQRQRSVALSTTESEYIAAAEAVKELIWVKQLISDLQPNQAPRVKLLIDNQSAIRLIKNPEFHKRSKHVDIKYHFIREKYDEKLFELKYVPSEDQIADVFTKALSKEKFCKFRRLMEIVS